MNRWTFFLYLLYGVIAGVTCGVVLADPNNGRKKTEHDDAYNVAWTVGFLSGIATLVGIVMGLRYLEVL